MLTPNSAPARLGNVAAPATDSKQSSNGVPKSRFGGVVRKPGATPRLGPNARAAHHSQIQKKQTVATESKAQNAKHTANTMRTQASQQVQQNANAQAAKAQVQNQRMMGQLPVKPNATNAQPAQPGRIQAQDALGQLHQRPKDLRNKRSKEMEEAWNKARVEFGDLDGDPEDGGERRGQDHGRGRGQDHPHDHDSDSQNKSAKANKQSKTQRLQPKSETNQSRARQAPGWQPRWQLSNPDTSDAACSEAEDRPQNLPPSNDASSENHTTKVGSLVAAWSVFNSRFPTKRPRA